jgi:hypothetical protein
VAIVPALVAVWLGFGQLFFRAHTWVLLLRPICFLSTILPDASRVGQIPSLTSLKGGIHDLMFSGHAALAITGATTVVMAASCKPTCQTALWVLKALLVTLCALQSLMIICTRKHYTVDVVVAWLLCPLLVQMQLVYP